MEILNEIETWMPVVEFEGIYEVSDLCSVKSLKYGRNAIMKPCTNAHGYLAYCLCKDGVQISRLGHQIVAMAFLGFERCGNVLVVDHISGKRNDNRLTNLQITTNRANCGECFRTKDGTFSSEFVGVNWDKPTKKWRAKIQINGKSKHL